MLVSLAGRSTTRLSRLARLHAELLRPHRRAMVLAVAAMLAGSLVLLPVSLVQGWFLDRLVAIAADPSSACSAALLLAGLGATIACHLGRLLLVGRGLAVMNRVSLEVVRGLTEALHRKLHRLPMSYFDRHSTGDILARLTSDVGTLMIFLGTGSLQLAADLVLGLGISVILVWLSWPLALVCLATVPLYILTHRLFAGRIQRLSSRVRLQLGTIYHLLCERLSAIRLVRSFAQEEAELHLLAGHLDTHQLLGQSSLKASAAQAALASFTTGLATAAVLVAGVLLLRRGQLSVGELLTACALAAQLTTPLARLVQMQAGLAGTCAAIDAMLELLDAPETLVDGTGARSVRSPRGWLHFQNVSFRYRPGGAWALRNINLQLEPGMTVEIIGPSGAGKSTLLALAARLYDPEAGCVRFEGQDVRRLRMAELRRAVALVSQQAFLFEGTLRSNLFYANPQATDGEARRVLEALDLAELVDSLPHRLDSPVGEGGVSLSGGQRQRLALARTLLARPALLLLDDCTSALDAGTEARVLAALDDLLPGRARLVVSHKHSDALRADWLLVLHDGAIVEQGPPESIDLSDTLALPAPRLRLVTPD